MTNAAIAFGGMAGTPRRAQKVEAALTGKPWTADTIAVAKQEFGKDYSPLTDMRASAQYRLAAAENMLERFFAESQGAATNVLEVSV